MKKMTDAEVAEKARAVMKATFPSKPALSDEKAVSLGRKLEAAARAYERAGGKLKADLRG
jgi:hypothetical protein